LAVYERLHWRQCTTSFQCLIKLSVWRCLPSREYNFATFQAHLRYP
jgi:hypothetical protein